MLIQHWKGREHDFDSVLKTEQKLRRISEKKNKKPETKSGAKF